MYFRCFSFLYNVLEAGRGNNDPYGYHNFLGEKLSSTPFLLASNTPAVAFHCSIHLLVAAAAAHAIAGA